MQVAEVLNKTIEILETKGWVQGSFSNENGYCVLGALNKASDESEFFSALHCLQVEATKRGYFGPAEFNDRRNRTKEEVIEFIKAAKADCG